MWEQEPSAWGSAGKSEIYYDRFSRRLLLKSPEKPHIFWGFDNYISRIIHRPHISLQDIIDLLKTNPSKFSLSCSSFYSSIFSVIISNICLGVTT